MAFKATAGRAPSETLRRGNLPAGDRSSEIACVEFDRHKYGGHLLVDACALNALPEFITSTRPHRLRFHEIVFLSGGSGFVDIDGTSTEVRCGRLLFTAPGQVRRWRLDTRLEGFAVFFEADFLHEFFEDARFLERLQFFSPGSVHTFLDVDRPAFEYLSAICRAMCAELGTLRDDTAHMLRAHLYRLLIEVQRLRSSGTVDAAGPHVALHKRFAALVDEHFRTVQQVARYADLLHVGPGHLNYAVRCATGATASDTIHQRIFLEARRLLLHTDQTVAAIATILGFSEASYFNRFFKRYAGMAPGEFRTRYENPVFSAKSALMAPRR